MNGEQYYQQPDASEEAMGKSILGPVLVVLNDLLKQGLLEDYAIGGGVAVLYYTEPILTYDFDVMCTFPLSKTIVDPSPVFSYLKGKGYTFGEEDRVNIEGVPMQFIPASAGLAKEALHHARGVTISGVHTRILTVEYLIALMLDLYRPKDRAKLAILLDDKDVLIDQAVLKKILEKYGLTEKRKRSNAS